MNGDSGACVVSRPGVSRASDAARTGATLRFERRCVPRYAIGGRATARFVNDGGLGRIGNVDLIDSSANGIAVEAGSAAAIGSCISLYFGGPVAGRMGIVRRCEAIETDGGVRYRLGISCQPMGVA